MPDLEYSASLDVSQIKESIQAIDKSFDQMAGSADKALADMRQSFEQMHKQADSLATAEKLNAQTVKKSDKELAEARQAQIQQYQKFGAAAVSAFTVIAAYSNTAISDARESMAAEAQLAAAIKSTGGAAGQSLAALTAHAKALQDISLYSDEDIERGQGLLLTFTNIKTTFPEATQTMLDMSQAMGQDLKSSAIQLGKALNDPIDGVGALTRIGVTFTEEQKKLIETMVKAGDTAGAQRVILAELNREFGGSAEAARKAAGAQKDLEVSTSELSESWGKLLLSLGDLGTTGGLVSFLNTLAAGGDAWTATIQQAKDLKASMDDLNLGFNANLESFTLLAQGLGELNPFVMLKNGVEGFYQKLSEGGDFFDAWRAGLENMASGARDLISGLLDSVTNVGQAINTPAPTPAPASSHPFANARVPAGTSHGPGHFAGGGIIPIGQRGIVGERGPELATVTGSGAYILPSANLRMNTLAPGSSGGTVNNNNNWSPQITLPDVAGLINNPVAVRQIENIVAKALNRVL